MAFLFGFLTSFDEVVLAVFITGPETTTLQPAVAHHQRSDVCAVPAAGVVAEAMVALVVADAAVEKFGGDSVGETRRNYESYLKHVAERGLQVHTP